MHYKAPASARKDGFGFVLGWRRLDFISGFRRRFVLRCPAWFCLLPHVASFPFGVHRNLHRLLQCAFHAALLRYGPKPVRRATRRSVRPHDHATRLLPPAPVQVRNGAGDAREGIQDRRGARGAVSHADYVRESVAVRLTCGVRANALGRGQEMGVERRCGGTAEMRGDGNDLPASTL
jgi:hypothetical protein